MKYTRYEYKKTGTVKILSTIIIIVSITVVGGFYVGNLIFKGKEIPSIKNLQSQENINETKNNDKNENLNIVAVQCGCFSKKENATSTLAALTPYCQPFISEQDGKFKVLAGIYDEKAGDEKVQQLKEKGIDVAKITLNIEDSNNKTKEVFNGFFQIADKFEENDTKGINTTKFKEWCNDLITDDDCKNDEKVKEIYNCMNELPEELERTNIVETEKKLYEIVR